ncbi:hypothetical protein [Saccharothrix obliqua]|uniref:hypothetical protein n=1 Tax=Saccharothrix obliqua TaxID=2861747 RepID=UPI001C5D6E57|nr:hypothetical protein [Saccharothrix obliqua]MBW4718313.1 hypothetical protein [Saccharothrix obliqua]
MLQQNTTKRIGYWLVLLHQAFDAATTKALRDVGLNRRQWQVLHAISIGVRTVSEIDEAFRPFLVADREESYRPVVEDFAHRGWAELDGDVITQTDAGVSAHESAEVLVNAHADKQLRGITQEEFLLANDVLRRIAENMRAGES